MGRKSKDISYENEQEARSALLEIFIYMCFLLVTTIVALSVRHLYMFYFNQTIEHLFLRREGLHHDRVFADVVTTNDWWHFLEHDFLANMHEQESANDTSGSSNSEDKHTFLRENILLGPPRMRQIRVHRDTCHVDEAFDRYFDTCYAEYARSIEDTSAEFKGTQFKTLQQLNAISIWGRVGTYVGGGYVKDLTFDEQQNKAIIEELKDGKWIDRGTRLVLVEFALYNSNTKLFDNVKFIAELPPIGGVLTSAQLQALKLHSMWTERDYVVLVAAVIFYLLLLFYTVEEVRELRKIGIWPYLRSAWNILDVAILLFGYISFAYNIWHPIYLHNLLERVAAEPDRYQSLDVICFWNLLFVDMMAICAFCVCIKIFKYISFNKTMLQFSTTLRRCAKDLLGFGLMFLIVFLAYAQLGLLLFGTKHPDFRNFHESFLTMMRMVLGDFEYTALEQANRILGPIYFLTYILLVFFILLNMFLAIINDTYSVVKSEIKHGRNHLQVFIAKSCYLSYSWLLAKCKKYCCKPRPPKSKEEPADSDPAKESEAESLDAPVAVVSGSTYHPATSSTSAPRSSTAVPSSDHIGPKPVRLRRSVVLNEYFEEVSNDPQVDTEEMKRLTYRMTIMEDLLEELIRNMDRILKKVDAKKRSKRD